MNECGSSIYVHKLTSFRRAVRSRIVSS